MRVAKRIEDAAASGRLASSLGYSFVLQNEGSRSLGVIGELTPDGVRLVPGDVLEIDASAPVRITVYDGGVQLDYGAPPPRPCDTRRTLG